MNNLIGKSLGRYHIIEQLGEGGMATVYKGYDTRLERNVAVKVLRTKQLAPAVLGRALKRFEREAKALAQLTHPNIVQIIDYGEFGEEPYFVMPFLPGQTLKHMLKAEPIPFEEAVRILLPIAKSLEYAHQQGVIHRDIKPSNILISDSGEPMLSDFGVAKIIDDEATLDLTGTGASVGTPEYMAPEQAVSKTVDHRTDIYSLGVVLYEMVTGRKPFKADTPLAVLIKQASEPLLRPKQFAPSLSNSAEQIILKALAKKPIDRFQTMGEFAEALESTLRAGASEPIKSNKVHADLRVVAPKSTKAKKTHSDLRVVMSDPIKPKKTHTDLRAGMSEPIKTKKAHTEAKPSRSGVKPKRKVEKHDQIALLKHPSITLENLSRVKQYAHFGNEDSDRGVTSATFSPVKTILAAGFGTGLVGLWRLEDGTPLQVLDRTSKWVTSVSFSPDGSLLASGSSDPEIKLFRIPNGLLLRTLKGHSDIVNDLAFSSSGSILVSGSDDNTVILWRASDGEMLRKLKGFSQGVWSVAISPDGTILASGSGDGKVIIWRISTGKRLRTLFEHMDGVWAMSFSPDGTMLATSSNDGTTILWDISSGNYLRSFGINNCAIFSIAFSPDGKFLISGSSDAAVRFWEVSDGALLYTLKGHSGEVRSVAFSLDGTVLCSGAEDGIRLWSVQ